MKESNLRPLFVRQMRYRYANSRSWYPGAELNCHLRVISTVFFH